MTTKLLTALSLVICQQFELPEEQQLILLKNAEEYYASGNIDPLVAAKLYEDVLLNVDLLDSLRERITLRTATLYSLAPTDDINHENNIARALELLENLISSLVSDQTACYQAHFEAARINSSIGENNDALSHYLVLRDLDLQLTGDERTNLEPKLSNESEVIAWSIVELFRWNNDDFTLQQLYDLRQSRQHDALLVSKIDDYFRVMLLREIESLISEQRLSVEKAKHNQTKTTINRDLQTDALRVLLRNEQPPLDKHISLNDDMPEEALVESERNGGFTSYLLICGAILVVVTGLVLVARTKRKI